MKILLIGEYSRLHNSLKEGLQRLGHEVLLVGSADGFRNYPIDIDVGLKIFKKEKGILAFFVKGIYRLLRIDLKEIEASFWVAREISKLKGFDVVQLINERSLKVNPRREIYFLKKIIAQNKKLFLLSAGTDYVSIEYALAGKFRYSIVTPYLKNSQNIKLKKIYKNTILFYLKKKHFKLHSFLYKNINAVIASDMDYHIPLLGNSKYAGLMPNPINVDKIAFIPLKITGAIRIFHGVNTGSSITKGNQIIKEALDIIEKKYPDTVTITTTYDIPYDQYIKIYDDCHILMDQVFSYDQGYNALEAMAKGKAVFTGAEKEFVEYYDLKETVAINMLPDPQQIASELEKLIQNPAEIIALGKRARKFIETNHHYIKSAQHYVDVWNAN